MVGINWDILIYVVEIGDCILYWWVLLMDFRFFVFEIFEYFFIECVWFWNVDGVDRFKKEKYINFCIKIFMFDVYLKCFY